MHSYCLCTQPATATLTQGAVVSTPSCFCCLDDAAAECVYAVDITPPVDCVSTAEKATTATAVDPSTTAGLVDVSPRPNFNFWVLSQCGFGPGLLTSASLPLNILNSRRQQTVLLRRLVNSISDHLYLPKWQKHLKQEKNTVITKVTLTISNGGHIKHTLSTSKPYRHQQHLPKISQNVSIAVRMAIRYGRNTCTVR